MKTLIILLTTTALVAGASSALAADFQASDEAVSNQLSHRMGWSGAYNSARTPDRVRHGTGDIPPAAIDFQAGGSN